MSIEERIQTLENELAQLKAKPAYTTTAYKQASSRCKEHFETIKQQGQHYGAEMNCEALTRSIFKEKHDIRGKGNNSPTKYIRTAEDSEEYFEIFKKLLDVYQGILFEGE